MKILLLGLAVVVVAVMQNKNYFWKGNMEKNKKGFTLIELVVVMVIVGILSAVSVPIYRGYVEKAIMAEGNTLLGAIAKAELAYYVQHKRFVAVDKTQASKKLGVDARGGKYFYAFYTEVSGTVESGSPVGFRAEAAVSKSQKAVNKLIADDDGGGSGYTYNHSREAVYIEVYGKYKSREYLLSGTQCANGGFYLNEKPSPSYVTNDLK